MKPNLMLVAYVLAGALAAAPAGAQCMLANPSFELPGSGGSAFAGWNPFGPVGTSLDPAHGAVAARVTGPNTSNWDVAGYWQPLDCAPGQRWAASACVSVSASSPLAGGSKAILNLEWRAGNGSLISYESHTLADASTPPGAWRQVEIESQAAPAGTATVRLLLGVLQGPGEPTPQVSFDAATCISVGPPTLESLQWVDFPSGRTVGFSGRTWRVKGTGFYGPGPNLFDHSTSAVWVDTESRLHLTIRRIGSVWYSSEVALVDALGYGDYVFTTRGRVDVLDPNTVFGLFLWEYGPCYDTGYLWWNPYNEIDVEFSRWGSPAAANAQFVAQPAYATGNIHRYTVAFGADEVASHAMRWLPDRVEFRSWRGGPDDESPANAITSWTYTGQHIPRPENPRVHLNLWQLVAPVVTQEVVVDEFTFRPACPTGNCGALAAPPGTPAPAGVATVAPNPFRAVTTIQFSVASPGDADLSVLDLAGRVVRRLAVGRVTPGAQAARWDGRDDGGRRVTPGIYFYRLRAPGLAASGRVVVLD